MARFSVVIPAHNESAVIARCLEAILTGAPAGEPEIIVVANGCTDDTAEKARRFGGRVRVIELEKGSKPLALNTGNEAATALPRFFVDADIEVSYASLAAAAEPLQSAAPRASAPAPHIDRRGLSLPARLYFGKFPDIIGDDLYVYERFARAERFSVDTDAAGTRARFTIFPPRTLASLIHVETRRLAAYDEMRALIGRSPSSHGAHARALLRLCLQPWLWPGLAVYSFVKLASRNRYRAQRRAGKEKLWLRDDSSRV